MSSSNNHSNALITLENYEEWFLLYVDEELNAADKEAVEAFAARYPHMQEELDLLCSTRLPAETLKLESKSELLSGHMKLTSIDESLLLYIDNELADEERKQVEQRLAADQDLQLQYRLLLQTRSDASETISFPDKQSLYRTTERRILPFWMRVAAAVVLVAGTGAAFWLAGDANDTVVTPFVAVAPAGAPQSGADDQVLPVTPTAQADSEVTGFADEPVLKKSSPAAKRKESKPVFAVIAEKKKEEKRSNNLPVPVQRPEQPSLAVNDKQAPQPLQQNNNKQAVTDPLVETYVSTEATTTTPIYATAATEAEKSGSLKGFLRKATRFIERRTGVSATNDNDELLIGAVAIKLK
jgi:anti-sigma factor RsiW